MSEHTRRITVEEAIKILQSYPQYAVLVTVCGESRSIRTSFAHVNRPCQAVRTQPYRAIQGVPPMKMSQRDKDILTAAIRSVPYGEYPRHS
jgi:hypothetical protein